MAYLERHNYIHRDLAARNCLVGSENVVKVGAAKKLYDGSSRTTCFHLTKSKARVNIIEIAINISLSKHMEELFVFSIATK
jgi:hypothetical protein